LSVQPVTSRAVPGPASGHLLEKYTGLDPHQLRHSAATHLGEQQVPPQLIMAKTRHKNPRTAMRYTRPGGEAVAEITGILGPPKRTH
jgi:integrase